MKFIFCLLLLLIGCGDDKKTVYGDTGPTPGGGNGGGGGRNLEAKFAEIKPIVTGSCLTSGCHADGAIVDLRTAEKFAASNSKVRVSGGSMPPPQSGPGKAFTAAMKTAIVSFYNK